MQEHKWLLIRILQRGLVQIMVIFAYHSLDKTDVNVLIISVTLKNINQVLIVRFP